MENRLFKVLKKYFHNYDTTMHFLTNNKISVIQTCIRFILLWFGCNCLSLNSSDPLEKYKTMQSL